MKSFSSSYIAMVVVQIAYGVSNIIMKLALQKGLNPIVFVVYRHLIAILVLSPFAYIFERKTRPTLSFRMAMKIFLLSSMGTTVHLNLYYTGLEYTSPTVGSALSNVMPSLTTLIAVVLGMETKKLGSNRGKAKLFGTLVCIGGSLIFTFCKGKRLFTSFKQKPLVQLYDTEGESRNHKENWVKGALLILISEVALSARIILQATVYKIYPALFSLNVLICIFASLQSSILTMFWARNPHLWKLDWNIQLLAIVYCGVVISALVYWLQTWCISKKGRVFAAMFSPLILVIVGIFSAIVFAERLYLGR
ncbi:WAT1-related protein At1g43650-like isoform X1 [Olea europaea var. sylvestris]|uniref:WAT1-related protein At1g43650-like isoform X1 n=1 Tax=Olea europaea var. sylvestris TaxID=158386 RepID=UPI000C1D3F31|nr:WAT1-related protein At1g43650-like isoform X1 [Olea europaea var. sylvestris]